MEKLIKSIASNYRIPHSTEEEMQDALEEVLKLEGVEFNREYILSKSNRVDFLIHGGLAIECKIAGSKLRIFRQCERYCQFDEVTALLLYTSKQIVLPPEINGKPTYVISPGKGWL